VHMTLNPASVTRLAIWYAGEPQNSLKFGKKESGQRTGILTDLKWVAQDRWVCERGCWAA